MTTLHQRRALWTMLSAVSLSALQIYVTGPGGCLFRPDAFRVTIGELRARGAFVVSPLDLLYNVYTAGLEIGEAAALDIATILSSDLVVFLDGWEQSLTTRLEVLTAYGAGVPMATVAAALEPVREARARCPA